MIFAALDTDGPLSFLKTLVHELEEDAPRKDGSALDQQLVLETYATRDESTALFHYLSSLLMGEYRRGVNVVLVIDDAHTYPTKSLLRLCRLTNLRVEGKSLVQIILVGRPALVETINDFRLWRVRRQLAVRVCVAPLTAQESQMYLHRRLTAAAAAYGEPPVLWPEGVALLAKRGQGIPRLLNMYGHDVLSAGVAAEQRCIATDLVRSVLPEAAPKWQEHALFSPTVPLMRTVAGLVIILAGMITLSVSGASYLRATPLPPLVSSNVRLDDSAPFQRERARKETTREAAQLHEVAFQRGEPLAPTLLPREPLVPQKLRQEAATFPTPSEGGRSSAVVSPRSRPTSATSVSPVASAAENTYLGNGDSETRSPQPTREKSPPAHPLTEPSARSLLRAPRDVLPTRFSAATTLTRKPKKSRTLAKEEQIAKVVKPPVVKPPVVKPPVVRGKASPPLQQHAVVNRPSPPRKKLSPQRAVLLPPARTSTRRSNTDRLFDE